jgi:hypothetical protein
MLSRPRDRFVLGADDDGFQQTPVPGSPSDGVAEETS